MKLAPLRLLMKERERDTYRYTFTADALHDAWESYLKRALFIGRQSISARRLCAGRKENHRRIIITRRRRDSTICKSNEGSVQRKSHASIYLCMNV